MIKAQSLSKTLGSKGNQKMFAKMKEFMHPDAISYDLIQQISIHYPNYYQKIG